MSNKQTEETKKFFKSKDGKSEYDRELQRLRESRIRTNTWAKEQGKRKRRNDERYE